jgi:protein SCO1/2
MNKTLIRTITVATIVIIIVATYSILMLTQPDKKLAGEDYLMQEAASGTAQIGGDFELTDHNGNSFDSKDYRGKLMLVYFGFTFCPDICPTAMQTMSEALNTLDKYNIDIKPVFITIDPARDDQESLKQFLSNFHPKITGLTGTEEEIRQVADKYKVFYAIDESTKDSEDYLLDHSSFFYLMDKQGNYLTHFGVQTSPEEMADAIRVNSNAWGG